MSNSTCFSPKAPQEGPPLFQHGNIVFQAHDVGWIVTGFFTMVATITSLWLVNKHLQWYTNKREQRYIVRILFMVPIYALISFASYLFWNHSTPLLLIRDGYESTVLTSFFYLLLTYLSPSPDEQKSIFLKVGLSKQADREARRKGEKVRKWVIPLSFIKAKPADGLYFLQIMKWGVLQYCIIRPTTTLAAVILNYFGWYCNDSFSPRWGHVYIAVIVSVSVSVAMYCLIQLYIPVAGHLAPHKPILKLFAVKAVVFLTFWQATLLSGLSMFGLVKDTQYMTADDINTGWSAIIETFEMMLFAFLHIRAFSYKPYQPLYNPNSTGSTPPIRTPRLRSLAHAFDFRETFREIWAGCIYISDRVRGVEPRPDMGARRMAMMEDAFGRARLRNTGNEQQKNPRKVVEVRKEVDVDVNVGGERQWLGLGDDYAYGLGYASRREKSDGLGEAIEKELHKRGVRLRDAGVNEGLQRTDDVDAGQSRASWWRTMYNRLSQSGADTTDERSTNIPRDAARRRSQDMDHTSHYTSLLYEYDDAPPPSIIHAYRSNRQSQDSRNLDDMTDARDLSTLNMAISLPAIHLQAPTDVLGPLPMLEGHSTPPPGTSNSSSVFSLPLFERPDSLLARVFPHGRPSISSSSAASTSSQSNRNPGIQSRTAKLRLLTNSLVVTPGNDPGRALVGSPVHGQIQVEHASDKGYDAIPHPHRSLLLSTSVEPDLVPPPVPPKSSCRGSMDFSKHRESPGRGDERCYRSSHCRESARHLVSHPSSPLPSPTPSLRPDIHSPTLQTIEPPDDSFNAMDLYMAVDNNHQTRPSQEPTTRLELSAQHYSATNYAIPPISGSSSRNRSEFDVVSSSYQATDGYQSPITTADPKPRPPDLSRAIYSRSSAGTRNPRQMSAPAPQFVTMPMATHNRNGYRSRLSVDNVDTPKLTVPAPLAPPPPQPQPSLPRDMRHVHYPVRRSPPSPFTPASTTTRYDLSKF